MELNQIPRGEYDPREMTTHEASVLVQLGRRIVRMVREPFSDLKAILEIADHTDTAQEYPAPEDEYLTGVRSMKA
ncbi:MAG: hypothetical protein U5L95_00185 [Candidatus Saccharibacteria bacterium]|nr:hypothetical protein [Candidatus Saccharibacteria bacterium]